MSINSLKRLAASKLCLTENNINIIKKSLPLEVYEYYLAIKNDYHRCDYCKKYFLNGNNGYCSDECWSSYIDNGTKYYQNIALLIFIILIIMIYGGMNVLSQYRN